MPTLAYSDDSTRHDDPGVRTRGLEAIDDIDALTESQWRALVARSFENGALRMDGMESLIADNTRMTRETADNTVEIREVVLMARSFFSGLGKFARGCAKVWTVLRPIIQACTVMAGAYMAIKGAIWAAMHGQPPTK